MQLGGRTEKTNRKISNGRTSKQRRTGVADPGGGVVVLPGGEEAAVVWRVGMRSLDCLHPMLCSVLCVAICAQYVGKGADMPRHVPMRPHIADSHHRLPSVASMPSHLLPPSSVSPLASPLISLVFCFSPRSLRTVLHTHTTTPQSTGRKQDERKQSAGRKKAMYRTKERSHLQDKSKSNLQDERKKP